MKLPVALQMGYDAGLTYVGEAVSNVLYHSMMIFPYDKILDEENELIEEEDNLYETIGRDSDVTIKETATLLGIELKELDLPEVNFDLEDEYYDESRIDFTEDSENSIDAS